MSFFHAEKLEKFVKNCIRKNKTGQMDFGYYANLFVFCCVFTEIRKKIKPYRILLFQDCETILHVQYKILQIDQKSQN